MKKLLSMLSIISCFLVLCSCNVNALGGVFSRLPNANTIEDVTDNIHVHNYSVTKYTETEHWLECECGTIDENTVAAHKGGFATCEDKAICTVCLQEYGELPTHNYNQIKSNAEKHWNECACGAIDTASVKAHVQGVLSCNSQALCSYCGTYYGEVLKHNYVMLKSNGVSHWYECGCGAIVQETKHEGGTATCTEQAACSVCGTGYGALKDHVYGEYHYDEVSHWYECECGEVSGKAPHRDGEATEDKQAICFDCKQPYGDTLGGN